MTESNASILLPLKWTPENYWRTVNIRASIVASDFVHDFPMLTARVRMLLLILWGVTSTGFVLIGARTWHDKIGFMGLSLLIIMICLLWRWAFYFRWLFVGLPIFCLTIILFALRNPRSKFRDVKECPLSIGVIGDKITVRSSEGSLLIEPSAFRFKQYRGYLVLYAKKGLDPIVIIPKPLVSPQWRTMLKQQLSEGRKRGQV